MQKKGYHCHIKDRLIFFSIKFFLLLERKFVVAIQKTKVLPLYRVYSNFTCNLTKDL